MYRYVFHNKTKFFIMTVLKTLSNGCVLYFSFIFKDIINMANTEIPEQLLISKTVFLITYCIIMSFLILIASLSSAHYSMTAILKLKNDFLQKLLNKQYSAIVNEDSGYYISMVTNDIGMLQSTYFAPMLSMIDAVILIIGSFCCLVYIDYKIALIIAIMTILFAVGPLLLKNILDRAIFQISKMNKRATSLLKDTLNGMDIVKTYGAEKYISAEYSLANQKVFNAQYKLSKISFFSSGITNLIINIVKVSLMMLATLMVLRKKLDLGSIITITSLIGFFYGPIIGLADKFTNILSSRSLRRTFLIILEDDDFIDEKSIVINDIDNIKLDNISFSYNDIYVLKDISLTIEKGKKYLILGESGCGKSTLIKIISGLYECNKGRIFINDIDRRNIENNSIVKNIIYCRQIPYLFNYSLKDNITLNLNYDEDNMKHCIKLCQLDNFVNNLPQGIDTKLNEEVRRVSEGEKQRINLARAIYRDAPIYLFDEVTASLDKQNSEAIEEIILNLDNKTVVSVSHKMPSKFIDKYDVIIKMDNGLINAIDKR